MITQEFNLNLHAGHSIPLVINVNQYEKNEQWLFTIINQDGTQYRPESASIVGTKSDGYLIDNEATVDSDGRVVVEVTEQIAAAAGKAVFELRLDDQTHGTANFVVLVEKSPADEGIPSESDLSLIQQAIDGTSATAIAQGVSDWMDENLTPTTPVVDQSLTVQGAAADAKKTGDEISELKSQIAQSAGLTADIKQALMDLANAVAFKGDDPTGKTIIDALEDALYPPVTVSSISAVYSGGVVYDSASLNSLKNDLVVTAHYTNGTSEVLADSMYTLSGTIAVGTQTITVTYANKTTTFTITVEHNDYLYVMPSEFVSTGANRLATNLSLSESQTVTFLVDFTLSTLNTSTTGHSADYVFGNKVSTQSAYQALQCIKLSSKGYMWGCGIGWNAGANLATEGHRYRFVCVTAVGTGGSSTINSSLKDVTAGSAVQTFSNTYSGGGATIASFALGKELDASVDNGFIGTVHDFRVYDGEMASADITDYLTNGAS